jgi:hypothetical protein
VPGELSELARTQRVVYADRQRFYSELLYYARERSYNPYWASHKYREKFGVWPKGLYETVSHPTPTTLGWIKSKNIAFAKSRRKSL